MNLLNQFKDNLNEKDKIFIGFLDIFFGIFCWMVFNSVITFLDLILLIFPAIILIIQNEKIQNNKILGIISFSIMFIFLIFSILSLLDCLTLYSNYHISFEIKIIFISYITQVFMSVCGLFCALLIIIPIKSISTTNEFYCDNEVSSSESNIFFCKECGTIIDENFKFCPECGIEINFNE